MKPEESWKLPPPGTVVVTEGSVREGDWFYIAPLGVWSPVPQCGWGEPILNSLIARGALDLTKVERINAPCLEAGAPTNSGMAKS